MTHAYAATGPFGHGTRADLAPGDLLTPGQLNRGVEKIFSERHGWHDQFPLTR
jgi:hypothetical protein